MKFKTGDKVIFKPQTENEELLEYLYSYLSEDNIYDVEKIIQSYYKTDLVKLNGIDESFSSKNFELYDDSDCCTFEIKCKKCGGTDCTIVANTEYDYDYDENLTPAGEYYEIKCNTCDNEYYSNTN